jgi:hypothetical protein
MACAMRRGWARRGGMRSARRPSRVQVNKRFDRPDPDVGAVLKLAGSRRGTRLELVCWELNADESRVGPLWELAVRHQLLKPDGSDPLNGQALFTLTERGRAALSDLKRRRR